MNTIMNDKNKVRYLLMTALALLVITKIIGNPVIGGLAVVFAISVACAVLTERLVRKRRN
ncbi:hypothetical protein BK703_16520 [Bacillus thuringiensis serovar silo]|nr:hypothetical protein [Bacillus thuringiensis]MDA2128675.1 hypothetical protein [Bacillus cereus]MED3275380.1 hypothetical protein [Bacillus thuringiensis]OTW55244.1 hypothetical protein BK703_16520 [Bacillus thuringiensis serovar silo]OTW74324.1 hypothetical protein BK700_01525 [Bacillus thuringiensis serovar toguchini]